MFNPRLFVSQRSKFAKITLAVFLVFLGLPLLASAQGVVPNAQTVFAGSPFGTASLGEIIINMIRVFFALLGFIALFLLLYGGFVWMTSQGEPDKVNRAKQIIYNAIIGLIIIFSAFAIATFVLNILRGVTGGGGGAGTSIPGGSGDWSRSALGAGPIESVYPKPNQTNVPINTQIAVTFKVDIKPETICVSPEGFCNGQAINNIEICERNDNDDKCKTDSEFSTTTFANFQVYQVSPTDFKTFIISSNSDNINLGNDDEINRTFKVLLKQGIMATSTGKSIFDGLRVPYYQWSFKTNGVLDLTPPEIAKIGLFPNPDLVPGGADEYVAGTAATAGSATLTINANPTAETPVTILNKDSQQIAVISALKDVSIKHDSSEILPEGFEVRFNGIISRTESGSANFIFTILNNSQAQASDSVKSNFPDLPWEDCSGTSNKLCLKIENGRRINTNSGFYLEATGSLTAGSRWMFTVFPSALGKTLTFTDGPFVKKFIYADPAYYKAGDKITRTTPVPSGGNLSETYDVILKGSSNTATAINTSTTLGTVLSSKITTSATGDAVTVTAKNAGANSMSLTSDDATNLAISSLAGTNKEIGWTVMPLGSKLKDPYNNSKIRITFTEAINPIGLENFVTVVKDGTPLTTTTDYSVSLTNQYRTIELLPKKVCGINACNEEITCWLEPSTTAPASTPMEVSLKAAILRYCASGSTEDATVNAWCKDWGGTCNGDDTVVGKGRCQYTTSGFNYPQADAAPGGLTDMANNSFNGNFNKTTNPKGQTVGNAEGQSGSGLGHGFNSAFSANAHLNSKNIFEYAPATPNLFGDDFKWAFNMSNQIDNSAPLINKVSPTGNQAYGQGNGERFSDPIKFTFGSLMSYTTAKPGYGYGLGLLDPLWHIRHLLLKTLTTGANPVGYWTNSRDIDYDSDGLADYTITELEHNAFDQSVSYGPLAGSGLQSLTQNCFLPGNGPQNAGDANGTLVGGTGVAANNCYYGVGSETVGCVTDSAIPAANRVSSTNPASYGYMNCDQVDGAKICQSDELCKIHTATTTAAANGSWVITKDHPAITDTATGRTGCCFGKCVQE
jgi:hypothetical protein